MAKGATIYKCNLNIANMDTHYYAEHSLTMAKHPSESDLRLMVRLVAFTLNASETLEFTKGIAQDDEPDMWAKDLSGDIDLWIDIGQPDEKRIRKACGRSGEVVIYNYLEGSALFWWKQVEKTLKRFKNLSVVFLKVEGDLELLAKRGMALQCNISDGEMTLIADENSVVIQPEVWKQFNK
ncbi:MAG: YaeQ family protein [Campylobacterota bacterium]